MEKYHIQWDTFDILHSINAIFALQSKYNRIFYRRNINNVLQKRAETLYIPSHSCKSQFVSIKKNDDACPKCASFAWGQHKTNNSHADILQARRCSGNILWRNQTAISERLSIRRGRTDFAPKFSTATEVMISKTLIITTIIIKSNIDAVFCQRRDNYFLILRLLFLLSNHWRFVYITLIKGAVKVCLNIVVSFFSVKSLVYVLRLVSRNRVLAVRAF